MCLIVYSNDHAPLTVRLIYSSSKLRTVQMMIFSLVAMIGLAKCCITSACLQWLCHSGERIVARGPLVYISYKRYIIFSLPRINISWKFMILFKTNCQGLFDIITLLNHVNFRLLMNSFRLIICKPPCQYCFTAILYFIFLQDLPTSIRKICCLILLVFGQLDLVLI